MAGIYIHIPFCKQACTYCDFHFSTNLKLKEDLLNCIKLEINLRQKEVTDSVTTIYFGGGTPSLLNGEELKQIIHEVAGNFNISEDVEITLEANPDDLDKNKLKELKLAGINRLSIGVQSFFNEDLLFMNRAHNEKEAKNCILYAQDVGFDDITMDLIYGYELLNSKKWEQNLETLSQFQLPHFSAYALTVEEGTKLFHQIKSGQLKPINEELAITHFKYLMDWAKDIGYEHYEISNFCTPGNYSKHNTSYWKGTSYIGIGPSAHSYFGDERRWNVSNNSIYIRNIQGNTSFFEIEKLGKKEQFNEYVMTSLRTKWGISKKNLLENFGENYWNMAENEINKYIISGDLVINNDKITLSEKGKFVADRIASDLFWIE